MFPKDLDKELIFKTSRSGGAGGQHVNKVSTKVQLIFDVKNSHILTDEQKELISKKLERKINKEGHIMLWSSATRSQFKNKTLVVERFIELVEKALQPKKKRKKTKIPAQVKKKRLEEKKRRSEIKDNRKKPEDY